MHPGDYERLTAEADPEYARIPAATRRYGISRSWLYREAALGRVRLVKLGNATLVDLASLRAFMAGLPSAKLRAPKSPRLSEPPAPCWNRRRDRRGCLLGSDILRDRDGGHQHGRHGDVPVHIRPAIRTSYGPHGLPPRPLIELSLTSAELHLLARAIEGEADAAERDGRPDAANVLSWRAAALREAGR